MSSAQVRNLKIFCSTWIAPRRLAGAGERAVELHPAVARLAGDLDAREVLARRDLQVGERLVVLQVARCSCGWMSLISRASSSRASTSLSPARKSMSATSPIQSRMRGSSAAAFVEVAAGPAAEVLRLADVDHPALGVLHQVDARACRETCRTFVGRSASGKGWSPAVWRVGHANSVAGVRRRPSFLGGHRRGRPGMGV